MFMGFFRYISSLFAFHKVLRNFTEFQHKGREKYAVKIEGKTGITWNPKRPGRYPERLADVRPGGGYRYGAWW